VPKPLYSGKHNATSDLGAKIPQADYPALLYSDIFPDAESFQTAFPD
jgi:hypothetical membrane protein